MAMRDWSERRRLVWRWGWGALIAALFLMPAGTRGSCSAAEGAGASQCTTSYVSVMGAVFGYSIPAP